MGGVKIKRENSKKKYSLYDMSFIEVSLFRTCPNEVLEKESI
jgi:hypothetical protein